MSIDYRILPMDEIMGKRRAEGYPKGMLRVETRDDSWSLRYTGFEPYSIGKEHPYRIEGELSHLIFTKDNATEIWTDPNWKTDVIRVRPISHYPDKRRRDDGTYKRACGWFVDMGDTPEKYDDDINKDATTFNALADKRRLLGYIGE